MRERYLYEGEQAKTDRAVRGAQGQDHRVSGGHRRGEGGYRRRADALSGKREAGSGKREEGWGKRKGVCRMGALFFYLCQIVTRAPPFHGLLRAYWVNRP